MNSAISIGEHWMWAAFIGFVLVMMACLSLSDALHGK